MPKKNTAIAQLPMEILSLRVYVSNQSTISQQIPSTEGAVCCDTFLRWYFYFSIYLTVVQSFLADLSCTQSPALSLPCDLSIMREGEVSFIYPRIVSGLSPEKKGGVSSPVTQ